MIRVHNHFFKEPKLNTNMPFYGGGNKALF
jgi:hypothetical protein